MSEEVGYKKPPKKRQFGQPEGNPSGKTSEQKKAEYRAGELAAQIQMKMLAALHDAVAADPDKALSAIAADPLRLIKDAMDRQFGTAVSMTADVTNKLDELDDRSIDAALDTVRNALEARGKAGKGSSKAPGE